jgi:hypothetical protein
MGGWLAFQGSRSVHIMAMAAASSQNCDNTIHDLMQRHTDITMAHLTFSSDRHVALLDCCIIQLLQNLPDHLT